MSFVEEVKECDPAGEQDADGREGVEIQQYSRADDSVDTSDELLDEFLDGGVGGVSWGRAC